MSVSEMLVLLIMQQKWRSVILVDADPEESASLLNSLNEGGVLIASVSVNAIGRYRWPEKYSLQPSFDGYIMTIRIRNTDEIFGELIHALKKNFLFGPHQRWIIGVKGCLKLDKALHFFDEGDKIVIIASETVETSACQSDFHSKVNLQI
ncbi:uncharacterized protein LOC129968541 [Argiope bruennichi]|uniref:uncharacterized protein LOC129968541 n=1 Tax=Argiope bruennichi TaxID=94029 RepID=UPI002494287A|nr:uncharacterized protein LOC129968541 [Argiope bruennichi]